MTSPARPAVLVRVLLIGATALAGCTVGPDYVRPASQLPAHFVERAPEGPSSLRVGQAWWTVFHDDALDTLIAEALQRSPDLEMARARVLEARAERAAVSGELLPEFSTDAAYARQHGSANVPTGTPPGGLGPGLDSNLWLNGFDASWELDLFGGTRRAVESADATLAATLADREEAELTLTAEIARDYIELRTEQRRLAIAREILSLRRDSLRLATAQFESGFAPALDPIRAQVELADSEAEVPLLEAGTRTAIYRLGVLAGRSPETLLSLLAPSRPVPEVQAEVPIGLPSDLLRRRPDIRAAERLLAAANARIGVREADLYPHFSLTGVAGFESLEAGSFLTGPSRYFAVGPSISWLVFDANRIRDEALAEQARRDAAAAAYRTTVLRALSEVESALVAYGRSEERRKALQEEVQASTKAVTLARQLYASGLQDYLTVLDAQRSVRRVEMSLATSNETCADSFIALVKALGGDWGTPRRPIR